MIEDFNDRRGARVRAIGLALVLALGFLTGCSTAPVRAEFGGSIWSDGQRSAGVLFQDGAQSIAVPGGTLWLFGDTFWGKPVAGQPPQNPQIKGSLWTTLAFLKSGQTSLPPALEYFTNADGLAANPLELLPGEDVKHRRIWPLGGISVGSQVYLYYAMIETTDAPGPWNFHGLGGGLAVSDKPLRNYTRLQPGGSWKFPVEPILVVREGQWLYLFEISAKPKGLILARVEAERIDEPEAYEFYTGRGWSKDRAEVAVVLKEAYGQVSVMRRDALGDYLMATSSDFSHPREIQLRTASHLEGPWSQPVRIAVPEVPGKKTDLVYCAYLHPELSDLRAGRVVVTFCRILHGDWQLCNPEWVTLLISTTEPVTGTRYR